jgi:hypothetical protein
VLNCEGYGEREILLSVVGQADKIPNKTPSSQNGLHTLVNCKCIHVAPICHTHGVTNTSNIVDPSSEWEPTSKTISIRR